MPVHNAEIADVFHQLADLLEIEDANPFRVRAYRSAAQTVNSLPRSAADMLDNGEDLSELANIGEDLAGKIQEIVETGRLSLLDEVEEGTPGQLRDLMQLPGIGAKRVRALHDQLDINNLEDLERAAQKHEVRELDGFGAKTEQKILTAIERRSDGQQRIKLSKVVEIADSLVAYLEQIEGVKKVVVAGSYRRSRATVGDLDILVTCRQDAPVMDRFVAYDEVDDVVSQGTTKSTVTLRSGLQVDLRKVAEVSLGSALHYFTGSKAHNIAVRKLAVKRQLKINEYGVFQGDERIAGRTEEEVYEQVGLPYIEPELREDRGEIEAAQHGELPELITLDDIRGDLHAHTKASDGHYTLEEMATAAKELGYDYLAVTDHSQAMTVAQGLDETRLRSQLEQIDRLNEKLSGIRLLKSSEVDVLKNGELDLDDDVLGQLDLVVCSIHSHFNLSRDQQTERVIRAMDNRHLNILGHPTGRLLTKRDAYEIDIERIIEAALERGCYLELNAQPSRLDLSDIHCKLAKEMGMKVAISTDAHHRTDLQFMRLGIGQARRGWLEADDVLNTRSWRDLKKLLKRT